MSSVRQIARLLADWEQRADAMLRQAEGLALVGDSDGSEEEALDEGLTQCTLSCASGSDARSS
jgi:hypothetical protein